MPIVSNAVCMKCKQSFILKENEMAILPNFSLRDKKFSFPEISMRKYEEWIEYVSTHCPECRDFDIPQNCLNDWNNHLKRLKRKN